MTVLQIMRDKHKKDVCIGCLPISVPGELKLATFEPPLVFTVHNNMIEECEKYIFSDIRIGLQ